MTVIGIDTASRVGGVALVEAGRLLGTQALGIEASHSERLLPALGGLMEAAALSPEDVEGIAVTVGPGSFTGLRIGLAVAKALGYAWRVPVRGVSTLLATAWSLRGVDGVVCAALDARRESVYSAFFDGRALAERKDPALARIGEEGRLGVAEVVERARAIRQEGRTLYLVGDGAAAIARSAEGAGEEALFGRLPMDGEAQRPANVAHLGAIELSQGRSDDLFNLVPNYLRLSEAERKWRQRQSP